MSDHPPATDAANPYGDPMLVAEPPGWPKVVGIISIVMASLGLTCGGCGTVFILAQPWLLKMAENEGKMGPAPDVMKIGLGMTVMAIVGVAMAGLLLYAGIALLRRRAAARPLHLVYGAIALVLAVISTVSQLQQQAAIAAWVKDNPDSKWAQQQSPIGSMIGMGVGLVIGAAWPVFCLVWFGAVKKTHREMLEAPPPE